MGTTSKLILALGLALLHSAVAVPAHASQKSRLKFGVTPVLMDDGDTPVPFNVSCTSSAWTVVLSSHPIRRSGLFQASSVNTDFLCAVSVTSATATMPVDCSSTTTGVELTAGSALTDFGCGFWYCRGKSGTATQRVKGYWMYDKGDSGGLP